MRASNSSAGRLDSGVCGQGFPGPHGAVVAVETREAHTQEAGGCGVLSKCVRLLCPDVRRDRDPDWGSINTMAGISERPASRMRRLTVDRCFWIVMAIVHAPVLVGLWFALIAEGPGSVRLSSFLGLNLSTVFFLLKVWGVRALEFNASRRSRIATTLAIALLHGNVIGAWSSQVAVSSKLPVTATVLLASGFSRVQRVLRKLFTCIKNTWRAGRPFSQAVCSRTAQPRRLLWAVRACTPRAPPLLVVPA